MINHPGQGCAPLYRLINQIPAKLAVGRFDQPHATIEPPETLLLRSPKHAWIYGRSCLYALARFHFAARPREHALFTFYFRQMSARDGLLRYIAGGCRIYSRDREGVPPTPPTLRQIRFGEIAPRYPRAFFCFFLFLFSFLFLFIPDLQRYFLTRNEKIFIRRINNTRRLSRGAIGDKIATGEIAFATNRPLYSIM